jgi:hypothetical protein
MRPITLPISGSDARETGAPASVVPEIKGETAMWRNRTVCFVGLTVALLAGCVVESSPRGPRSTGGSSGPRDVVVASAGLTVRWDLAYLDDELADCAVAGTPVVTVTSQLRGTRERFTASFPCEIGVGLMDGLPPGTYDVALDLEDDLGRVVSVVDFPGVPTFSNRVTETEVGYFPVQVWDVAWSLAVHDRYGRATQVSCGQVGATTVRFITQYDLEPQEAYDLPCPTYGGITTAIRPGDYLVQMLLLDRAGRLMAETDIVDYPVDMDAPALVDVDFGL